MHDNSVAAIKEHIYRKDVEDWQKIQLRELQNQEGALSLNRLNERTRHMNKYDNVRLQIPYSDMYRVGKSVSIEAKLRADARQREISPGTANALSSLRPKVASISRSQSERRPSK